MNKIEKTLEKKDTLCSFCGSPGDILPGMKNVVNEATIFQCVERFLQSAVVQEVERWPHTPMSVGSNPSAAVDCLP